jgi:SNF2 family DNA or RNA helicase
MDMYCHRVTKEEALDLPDKLPDEIYDIELKEKKLYKELHKDGASLDYDLLLENPLARLTKLRQVCSGFLTLEDGQVVELKSEKLEVLEDFLDGWEKKLVIFCEYKHSIRSISKLLKKLKFKHVILDGEQKDKDIWKQFQSDESIRVIICQYQSGAQGIDLFAADTIIYYEPTLSSTTLEQSRDRIHRIGQTQKCSYIHFITKNSVEEDIYKALAKYEDFSERLFESYIKEYIRSYSGGRW